MATLRQRLAVLKISENIRNNGTMKPMGQILKEVGYSESVCKHPDRVTNTKGWEELMNQYLLQDEELLRIHNKLLNAQKVVRISLTGEFITQSDYSTISKALDLAYKIKGKYVHNDISENLLKDFDHWTDKELLEYVASKTLVVNSE